MGYAAWGSDCEEMKQSAPKQRNVGENRIGTTFRENGEEIVDE